MIEKINISDPSIAEEIRKQMAVSTSTNKGLESPNDKKAILTTKTWDEFISIGRRIGAGNSVVFSSAVAWENNGFGTSYSSGIITNKGGFYITVFCITGKAREYNVKIGEWGDIK